jgi:mitochondrial fission protein ELM1
MADQQACHRNQLKGLGNRLRVLSGASIHWIDVTTVKVPAWRALLGLAPVMELPRPDLIVACGNTSHRLLLSLRRTRNARTLVLMKPAFPLAWVNAAIVPEYEGVTGGKRVLVTEGPLNAITPMARITEKPEALVLVGGPSPHYDWDDESVRSQLVQLMQTYPEWRWTVSTSRDTPEDLGYRLESLTGPKVTLVKASETHETWLPHALAASRAVWVTPESSTMVTEAATAGLPVGVFELPARTGSRVATGIDTLQHRGLVARWQDHRAIMNLQPTKVTNPLWEADRAARWVIENLLERRRR